MIFGFVAKHRAIWPVSWMCETLGVSRSATTHGSIARPASGLGKMTFSSRGSAQALLAAIEPMAHVGFGMTFWRKVWMPDCIASSG